jgi:hypothetical protein
MVYQEFGLAANLYDRIPDCTLRPLPRRKNIKIGAFAEYCITRGKTQILEIFAMSARITDNLPHYPPIDRPP